MKTASVKVAFLIDVALCAFWWLARRIFFVSLSGMMGERDEV